MDQTFMKEKPVLPLVLKMALPMVISMLVNSLYNIVDSFFVAQVSEDAMTAISIVYPLQNLANAIGVGFGVGINAAVAYYLGANNGKAANRSATLGIILSALHGIVLAGICVLLIRPFISMFTDSEQIIAYGLDYFYVVIAFAPVLTLGMAFEKVLQATGKMKTTMFCMAIGAVANIILDPIFISGLGAVPAMGVFGAALATGIGQTLSLISYIAVFLLAKIPVRLRLEHRGEEKICRKLYFVGIPASLNLALPSFMITVLNAILAAFAEVYVLILGVYYKLQTFIYFTISGIVQGIRPLISYNLGAGRKDRVIGIFKVTLLLSLGVMVIGTILCLPLPCSSQAADGHIYRYSANGGTGSDRPAHHKRRIYCFGNLRRNKRNVRGAWQRHAVFDHISASVYRHSPHSVSYVLSVSGRRRMAFVLDNGIDFRHRLVCAVLVLFC